MFSRSRGSNIPITRDLKRNAGPHMQQPVLSIDSQNDIEDSRRQGGHGVDPAEMAVIAFFDAGLAIEHQSFLRRNPSRFNGDF
jgi:hypothetical protein